MTELSTEDDWSAVEDMCDELLYALQDGRLDRPMITPNGWAFLETHDHVGEEGGSE